MSPVNFFATSLMPISQVVAWLALYQSEKARHPIESLYTTLAFTSAFYCVWALYKKYGEGEEKELGHISMGLTAVVTFLKFKYPSLGAIALVLANFALPIFYVIGMPAQKLSKLVKDTESTAGIIWAWIFKVYLIASFCFWTMAFYKVWNLPAAAGQPSGKKDAEYVGI